MDSGLLGDCLARYHGDIALCEEIQTIEDVISVYEQAIPSEEKTKNGAIYTPGHIREYIVSTLFEEDRNKFVNGLIIDPACGCGAFLYTAIEVIRQHSAKTYSEILPHIFGVDISELSVHRAKILLALAAITQGEVLNDNDFNLTVANSLSFDFESLPGLKENGGFDIVVGNPPYVRAKHIDEESKALLPCWSVTKGGNADLYLPFFELGIKLLNHDGKLGYITVNTFFKSVNARILRKLFSANKSHLRIIDFGDELIFEKKLAYTCIAFISKTKSNGIKYCRTSSVEIKNCEQLSFDVIPYSTLNDIKGWNLNRGDVLKVIHRIESIGTPLGQKYSIKNGIATLANDLFIFRPISCDDKYYYLSIDGLTFPIEKGLCRDIIKPNILHCEEEIPQIEEKVIFPYSADSQLIPEAQFIRKYPKAYAYLALHRRKLDARDKGEGNFPAWYAFGRTQAISDRGRKLLFPYMSADPHFVYTDNRDMLIYCGYAIFHEDERELLVLKRILESSVFNYYMRQTSKPYATGYYSYAKNYVKNFGVVALSDEQQSAILNLTDTNQLNSYIEHLYGVNITENRCIEN